MLRLVVKNILELPLESAQPVDPDGQPVIAKEPICCKQVIWVAPRAGPSSQYWDEGLFILPYEGGISLPLTKIKTIWRQPETYVNQEVEVQGWIRTLRATKNVGFIELNDGSFLQNMQIVFSQDLDNFAEIAKLPIATALTVRGLVVATPQAKQPVEIQAQEIAIEAPSQADYPLQKKRHSREYLREIAHLRPRSNLFSAVFRVRSVAAFALHKFFQERGYIYVHTPIITASDAEGAGEMFHVTTLDLMNIPRTADGQVDFSQDFFAKKTGLTVSGQLEAEIFALAFRNVYTFGPTFRAENSNTPRHAAEFWMLEPEIAFADLEDNMNVVEDMLKYVLSYTLEELPEEFAFFNQFVDKGLLERLQNVIEADFARITYTEAIDLLLQAERVFEFPLEWGIDLQTEHERYLSEHVFAGLSLSPITPKISKPSICVRMKTGKQWRPWTCWCQASAN